MAVNLKTVIVDSDPESRAALRRALASIPSVVVVSEFGDVAECLRVAPAHDPDVVILEVTDESAAVVGQAARALPGTAIVATGSTASADVVVRAIRAGAIEFLRRPVDRAELVAALDKLARVRRSALPSRRSGRITAVYATKGGLGATTLAVNLAVCLAERTRTLLIELDTRQSDVSALLDLRPRFSILDAFDNLERMDESLLQGLLIKHASGLSILPGPAQVERVMMGADQVNAALEIARSHFEEVVLDIRHDLDRATVAALGMADSILFLTALDVVALRSGAAGLAAFRSLDLDLSKVKAVVMRDGTGADVTLKHAVAALGIPIYWKTPSDYGAAVASSNEGRPVVSAAPRSKIARNVRELAEAVLGAPGAVADASARRAGSLLRMLTPKRLSGAS
jgi:pilus assembly protein CpaE